MQRERMDRTGFYLLAFIVSGALAMTMTALTDRLYTVPSDNGLYGLMAFFFIVILDLFVMYDVWSMRYEKEGWIALRWLAGLAVVGLLLASMAGLLLYYLALAPLKAFVFSAFIVQSVLSLIERRWLEGKEPGSMVMQPGKRRFMTFMDGVMIVLGLYILIFGLRQESGWAILSGFALALVVFAPMVWNLFLRIQALRSEQTADPLPPATTS